MPWILIFILCANGGAQPILFRAPGVSDVDYHARLRAAEDLRTPTQAFLADHPRPSSREALLARFGRAQEAFLGHSIAGAKQHFLEVIALLHADDWSKPERELFLHAFLRLAQLEANAAERRHWLDQTLFLGIDLQVSPDLFPPPLLSEYRSRVAGSPKLRVTPEVTGWPLLLINGMPCRAHECPPFPALERSVRVTYLSDQWAPQTLQLDLARLARERPPRTDWVTGSCGQARLAPAARALGEGRAFFGFDCEDQATPGAKSIPAPLPTPALATAPPATSAPAATSTTTLDLPRIDPPKPFYKSKWMWASVGVIVVGGLTYALTRNHRSARGSADDAGARGSDANVPATVYNF